MTLGAITHADCDIWESPLGSRCRGKGRPLELSPSNVSLPGNRERF